MPNPTIPLIEHLDLITSVDLSHVAAPGQPEIYHFLYASSLYGTLFGMYGKFTFIPHGSNHIQLQSLSMRILNYQGVLNIGFDKDPARKAVYDPTDKVIDFWVQGASGEDAMPLSNPAAMIIEKGKRFKLSLNRVVMPLNGFSTSTDTARHRGVPSQKDPLFDTEFHYRDGIDNFHQLRRDGMGATHRSSLVGARCITSVVYLLA